MRFWLSSFDLVLEGQSLAKKNIPFDEGPTENKKNQEFATSEEEFGCMATQSGISERPLGGASRKAGKKAGPTSQPPWENRTNHAFFTKLRSDGSPMLAAQACQISGQS